MRRPRAEETPDVNPRDTRRARIELENAEAYIRQAAQRAHVDPTTLEDLRENLWSEIAMRLFPHDWRTIQAMCVLNRKFARFCRTYGGEKKGGLLGLLLRKHEPHLANKRFPNLSYMVLKYAKKRWDLKKLWSNHSLTPSVMLATQFDWPKILFASHPNFTLGFFKTHMPDILDIDAFWANLSNNPSITWADVSANIDRAWFWKGLSSNPGITIDDVNANIDRPWDWWGLSKNPNVTMDFVKSTLDRPWNWETLSASPSITWEDIRDNVELWWYWRHVSTNPNITPAIVEANPGYPWDWWGLCANPSLTPSFIQANIDRLRDVANLSANPNITWDIVKNNRHIRWAWGHIYANPGITWEDIRPVLHKIARLHRSDVSKNPNITMNIVKAYPDFPWEWGSLSANPGITWADVAENMHFPWFWTDLSAKTDTSLPANLVMQHCTFCGKRARWREASSSCLTFCTHECQKKYHT